jgi:hypothetical protein
MTRLTANFSETCRTEADRVASCFRYQQRQQDKREAGEITEDERMERLIAIMPLQLKARLDDEAGVYRDAKPTYVARKSDWDGVKFKNPPGLDTTDKAEVFSHRRKVFMMNKWDAEHNDELIDITRELEKARIACSNDITRDGKLNVSNTISR